MRIPVSPEKQRLTDATYVELVRSLFRTRIPTAIMGVLFALVSGVCMSRLVDPILFFLAVVGSIMSIVRVVMLLAFDSRVSRPELDLEAAKRIERSYSVTYLLFALILGIFTSRVLALADDELRAVVCTLLVGYAAGVAAGVSLRPKLGVSAIFLAVVPSIATAISLGGTAHLTLAVVLSALMVGGVSSMIDRYRSATQKISLRNLLGSLAREDQLTGLANRLGLADAFAKTVGRGKTPSVAVHCIDLDHFKPVNDEFGHPVGDQLLQEVARRLSTLARDCDTAARLGGDEFAIIQTGVSHVPQVEFMARRIVRAIAEPYNIGGRPIVIGTSLGYALTDEHGQDLQSLLMAADEALYTIKRNGRGGAGHAKRPTSRKLRAMPA